MSHPRLYGPGDKNLSPALGESVAAIRGGMAEVAERHPLPARFEADLSRAPTVVLTDLETGRQHEVPLFAYGEVRKALSAFFGG